MNVVSLGRKFCSLNTGTLLGLAILLAATGGTGCSKGPAATLVPVSGLVQQAGVRITSGSVTLRPEEKGAWHQPTGRIEADGKFVIYTNSRAGAPPGDYRVVVFSTQILPAESIQSAPKLPQSGISSIYNDPQRTPLRLRVPKTVALDQVLLELLPETPPAKRKGR